MFLWKLKCFFLVCKNDKCRSWKFKATNATCIFTVSSNLLFSFSNILSFLNSHISFPDLALSVFPFFFTEVVWRDGAHIALDESQLRQVRHATLTSASCLFVKSLLSQGCSIFLVLKAFHNSRHSGPVFYRVFFWELKQNPWLKVIVASEVLCFNLAV